MAKKGKIYTNLYVKRRLMKLEIDIFGIIANGLLHHTPKQKILLMIQKEIRVVQKDIGLNTSEVNQIYAHAYDQYMRMSKGTYASLRRIEKKFGRKEDYEQSLAQRRVVIYNNSRALIQDNYLIKEANKIMYSYEQRKKHDSIWGEEGLLAVSREITSRAYSPFFLASSHPKPAKDHADWEGKIYFDQDWEQYVDDSHDQERIRAYIRNHKLRSVQWVVGEPVYLCTRRNCKHFMINVDLEEVLHSSRRKLLSKHKLYMKNEEPASDALINYRNYYNRLKTEISLYELIPNEVLKKDIKNDKKLLDKWKNMM